MKTTVSFYQFREQFRIQGRESQFSRDALSALFDYIEELESDTGEEIELDVIGLCCDYAEYADALDAAKAYNWEGEDEDEALEWLRDRTTVIEFSGGIIIGQF